MHSMTDYQSALAAVIKELAELMRDREAIDTQRERLDQRIFQLREGMVGLAILCGTDTTQLAQKHPELFPDLISSDTGLTDAIRKAMQSKRLYVSPVEVRDRLVNMGYDVSKHGNVLASIHTILRRLAVNEEIEEGTRDGKVVYRIVGPLLPDRRNPNAEVPFLEKYGERGKKVS